MIIFSPGPSNISERVRRAQLGPDINHRGPEFRSLLAEIRSSLLKVCRGAGSYRPVIFTGSGTSAIEASLAALKGTPRNPLLVVSNGFYADRAFEIARLNGLNVHKLVFKINEVPDADLVRKKISKLKASAVYFVHHETGTGLLNPIRSLASAAKKAGAMVLVDTISSIAGEELCLRDWGIDVAIGSSNKCIRGTPGLAFVLASERYIRYCAKQGGGAYYLNLINHLEYEEKGQTPFTPAVHTFYAFREALRELLDEGVERRIRGYQTLSGFLRKGLQEMGLELYLDHGVLSNTMTCALLPSHRSYGVLYAKCRAKGFEIYPAMGSLVGRCFRAGIVGKISIKDVKGFLTVLKGLVSQIKG